MNLNVLSSQSNLSKVLRPRSDGPPFTRADGQGHGTLAATRCGTCCASRPGHRAVVRGSARTLGLMRSTAEVDRDSGTLEICMDEQIQSHALTELIDRYCAVWSEPGSNRRTELLGKVWAHDATYTDPRVHAATSAELLAHIELVLANRPGAKVVRTSAVDIHHGVARFSWHVVQADGTALPDGLDIAEFSSDGQRIRRIVGFFGPLQAL
jgi:hypothetical protein